MNCAAQAFRHEEGIGLERHASEHRTGSNTRRALLVADADPWIQDPIVWLLEQADYEILAAEDGRDAITLLERHTDEIVAVLLDSKLPGVRGEELFEKIQHLRHNIPVIMMSGFAEEDVIGRFLGMGVVGFLKKPFGPLTLFQAVRKALGRSVA
jgi:DNA-binding response OmpR family regulator